MHKAKGRPAPGTEKLLVTAGGRCGPQGLKMFGFHFTSEATEIAVEGLDRLKATRICRHGDLDVVEVGAGGEVLRKPAESPKLPPRETPGSTSNATKKGVPSVAPKKKRGIFGAKKDDSKSEKPPKKRRQADNG